MASLTQTVPLEVTVGDVVKKVAMPLGVKFLRVDVTNDFTGDPAVYITFGVSKSVDNTTARMKERRTLMMNVVALVQGLVGERIPYVQFKEVR